MMTRAALIVICLLVGLFAGGCGRPAERVAERRINALLPQFLGPADRWTSRVSDNPLALARGRLRRVRVDGDNVRVSDSLTLDHLTLHVSDLRVDTKQQRISGVGGVRFSATLSETNVNRYLRARRPDIPGLSVSLGRGEARVSARPEVAGLLGVPLSVRGTLRPRLSDGGVASSQLDFVPGGGAVSVVPVPSAALRFVAERVNPLIDLAVLKAPLRVEQVAIEPGQARIQGTVDGAALLRAAAAGGNGGAPPAP